MIGLGALVLEKFRILLESAVLSEAVWLPLCKLIHLLHLSSVVITVAHLALILSLCVVLVADFFGVVEKMVVSSLTPKNPFEQ